MMKEYRSIFNDVLGPIMNGPSSSHSAGCCRIGLTVRTLYGKEIKRAKIVFEKKGSYPNTYIGQGSDFGFVGGLLGIKTEDPKLKDSIRIAKNLNKDITFEVEDLGFKHPNQAEIQVLDENGLILMRAMTFSVGGGMFEIRQLDEFDVLIDGTEFQYFICYTASYEKAVLDALQKLNHKFTIQTNDVSKRGLVILQSERDIRKVIEKSFETVPGINYIRCSSPVVPSIKKNNCEPPFFNAEEALEYAREKKRKPWQLCEDYEMGYTVVSCSEIRAAISRIRNIMELSLQPPDPSVTKAYGILPYKAKIMGKTIETNNIIDVGFLNETVLAAVAVLENSCAHNIIVAAPTAGSSGVVPATVVFMGKKLGCSCSEIEKALMVSGVVGVLIANQATFGGEVGGCQAEIGSAAAMASAGVIQLLGGTIEQCFTAASMSLQNMLGLICDPVAGLTEIPCISRNVSAVANAVMSANLTLMGFDPVIPLDEVVHAMNEVGGQLPSELKCTCFGGLCTTATGKSLSNHMQERWNAKLK